MIFGFQISKIFMKLEALCNWEKVTSAGREKPKQHKSGENRERMCGDAYVMWSMNIYY